MTNPHTPTASGLLLAVKVADSDSEDRAQALSAARTEATLAVAFEQARTADALEAANLIAYLNAAGRYRLASPAPVRVMKAIQADVETRLGLA